MYDSKSFFEKKKEIMNIFRNKAGICFSALLCTAALAQAQATRTWVSGVGDDANPCSRTAPCKTFAGAISKTAAGGEIDALDPGGFGTVTITKAITLNGQATLGSILSSGTNGITVNAGPSDTVVLRKLSVNGAGTGMTGIRYIGGAAVSVEDCTIDGFTVNGIEANLTTNGRLTVRNTSIGGGAVGVKVNGTTGRVSATISNSSIRGAATAVDGLYGTIDITRGVFSDATSYAILAEGGLISVSDSLLVSNSVAVQAQTGATVRLSNNDVYENLTGFGCGGGTIQSAANNRKGGNTGGMVPTCNPTGSVTIQ